MLRLSAFKIWRHTSFIPDRKNQAPCHEQFVCFQSRVDIPQTKLRPSQQPGHICTIFGTAGADHIRLASPCLDLSGSVAQGDIDLVVQTSFCVALNASTKSSSSFSYSSSVFSSSSSASASASSPPPPPHRHHHHMHHHYIIIVVFVFFFFFMFIFIIFFFSIIAWSSFCSSSSSSWTTASSIKYQASRNNHQSINRSINQSTNQPTNQPINYWITHLLVRSLIH